MAEIHPPAPPHIGPRLTGKEKLEAADAATKRAAVLTTLTDTEVQNLWYGQFQKLLDTCTVDELEAELTRRKLKIPHRPEP